MDQIAVDQIRFCSFCPNICRIYYPPSGIFQKESTTCSALSYTALAVIKGFIAYDEDVKKLLSEVKACEACKEACPYNYDIPKQLKRVIGDFLEGS